MVHHVDRKQHVLQREQIHILRPLRDQRVRVFRLVRFREFRVKQTAKRVDPLSFGWVFLRQLDEEMFDLEIDEVVVEIDAWLETFQIATTNGDRVLYSWFTPRWDAIGDSD